MKRRWRVALLATAAVGIAGWATLEGAGQGQEPLPVQTYNGCIAVEDGTLYGFTTAVAVAQCQAGDAEASLSSGDVTEVAGGEGLTGGAKSGPATLGIATSYRLPQDCAQGESISYEGGEWGCRAPLDASAFAKSDQTCPPGSVASGIDVFGDLVCVEQARAGGPSTDWTGVANSLRGQVDVIVHNPSSEPATMTVRAFDREGGELRVVRKERGVPPCEAITVPAGGARDCLVNPLREIALGAVYVHADLPVLAFGNQPGIGPRDPGFAWQLDWYPFCPEHVGTCDG